MFDESLIKPPRKNRWTSTFVFGMMAVSGPGILGRNFWDTEEPRTCLHHIKECGAQMKMRQLMSVSMDGPNVNFKLVNLLQERACRLYGGAQLVLVGSCGLHTLHTQ
ncbi:hypothetical protein KUCAC02_002468 [Chaenocephalus aceratus]|uniref:Uncharacterized protein n=1 Tax=Chaenocephalus aceratus TaxID=36190 RepID=A0ACB9XVW4_CHAAC|nr:hypothetical protein KUCAC02_002468 [Chaenocephalus aceratus]